MAVVSISSATGAGAQAPAAISGGGASFPQLELEQWRADVARPPYSLAVDYQAAGSTFGREKYISGQLDYGVSDIPFQNDEVGRVQASARKNFVYVPVSAGGLGFMYNVTGTDGQRITSLKLSQRDLCRVFTEEAITWNDPEIQAENPGLPLPADPVRPVVRSDGSGTSYVLSEFCIATAADVWARFISMVLARSPNSASVEFRGGQPTSQWPNGYGNASTAYASDGVANTVANDVSGRSTITFVEAGFAKERGFPNAQVRNAAGVYHSPDPGNVTAALAYATGRADGTFQLDYLAKDPNAYFPSSYSYVIAQTAGFPATKGVTLATFLYYAVTVGQKRAEPLGYARLSDVLVRLALAQASKIPGAGPPPTDLAGAPPPPRAINLGGAGAIGGPAATKGATTPAAKAAAAKAAAASAAGATAAAADAAGTAGAAGRDASGNFKIDVSKLPTAAPAAATPIGSTSKSTISNGEVLWTFLLGMGLVAVGVFGTSVLPGRDSGGASGGGTPS